MDGIGLAPANPDINPFAAAEMPNVSQLLGGQRLVSETAPFVGDRATLQALDACLDVDGFPQSATGQAALVTGKNVSASIGGHFGPKPNEPIRDLLRKGSLFSRYKRAGLDAVLINAYPPGYFEAIQSGRRMYSAIPMSVDNAGIPLMTEQDYRDGKAMAADFTGEGWRTHLGYEDTPVLEAAEAGKQLASLTQRRDFTFFEFWVSDYIGHGQDMQAALEMLTSFDRMFGGLLEHWDDENGLLLITSDHGNMEDLGTRRHTKNPVPGLLVGSPEHRIPFMHGLTDLTQVAGRIEAFAGIEWKPE
jgi:hypothetical protein